MDYIEHMSFTFENLNKYKTKLETLLCLLRNHDANIIKLVTHKSIFELN